MTSPTTRLLIVIFSILVSSLCAACARAGEPETGVTPEAPPPPADRSAEDCLDTGLTLIEEENFPRARAWLAAARDRADDSKLKQLAEEQLSRLALLGRPAPDWLAGRWLHGRRMQRLDHALAGKVVLLHFFRTNDVASQHSINHAITLADRHGDAGLAVISFAVMPGTVSDELADDIKQYVVMRGFNHPVALDADATPVCKDYLVEAVPFAALLDRDHRLRRLGDYYPDQVERTAVKLLAEKPGHKLPGPAIVMPASRGGLDLIDRRAPQLRTGVWLNTDDGGPPDLRGRPRLIRFFADDCAYCRASAPALNRIQRDYADRGLMVIGIYHPKPAPREVPYKEFRAAVRRLELGFPVTMDPDWAYLRALWLDGGDRPFTSAAFVIDRKGVVRLVHPGPDFFPSDDPAQSRQNDDYLAIRRAIEKVLAD